MRPLQTQKAILHHLAGDITHRPVHTLTPPSTVNNFQRPGQGRPMVDRRPAKKASLYDGTIFHRRRPASRSGLATPGTAPAASASGSTTGHPTASDPTCQPRPTQQRMGQGTSGSQFFVLLFLPVAAR